MLDKLPTAILAHIISETNYDTALALSRTNHRLSAAIRSPNNDAAIFKKMAQSIFPWLHPAIGQTWQDLAYDIENLGPESDAEVWKETAQWTLADPDTDLGLMIFAEHPMAKEIAERHVTRHMNERVSCDTETWGDGLVEHGGVVIDFVKAVGWRKEKSAHDLSRNQPTLVASTGEDGVKTWLVNGQSIPVASGFIPSLHYHNGQLFVFETTVDSACPDTAMSNLHVIDTSNNRYIFLLSLIHEAGIFPTPFLSNGFLWLFYEHFLVKFNVDNIRICDKNTSKYTTTIYFVSQFGLPTSLRDCDFQVNVLWGRFAKTGHFFLDLEDISWFKIDDGLVHGMLHKTHHLWDYSTEVLDSIVELVGDSPDEKDISGCLKIKKKKKKSKGKSKEESKETKESEKEESLETVEKAVSKLSIADANKDLPPELQID